MARRHGGLGRGLDALIPIRDEVEEAMRSADVAGSEVLFSDDEDDFSFMSTSTERHEDRQESPNKLEQNTDTQSPDIKNTDTANLQVDPKDKEAVTVRISEVEPNRGQPRKYFDEKAIDELSDSIKKFGLLQPILVQEREDHYEIIAGERRWRAAMKAGLKEVPVIVRKYSEQEILELSLIENIQRENLNPIEEAKAYRQLMDEFHLKQDEIGQRVSKSRSAITNTLRLLKLDDRVQQLVVDGTISMGHARALIPLEDGDSQFDIAQKIVDESLSVRSTEKLIKEVNNHLGENSISENKTDTESENNQVNDQLEKSDELIYKDLEEKLKQALSTKVVINRKKNGRGKLQIEFYSDDDLEKLIDRLTTMG